MPSWPYRAGQSIGRGLSYFNPATYGQSLASGAPGAFEAAGEFVSGIGDPYSESSQTPAPAYAGSPSTYNYPEFGNGPAEPGLRQFETEAPSRGFMGPPTPAMQASSQAAELRSVMPGLQSRAFNPAEYHPMDIPTGAAPTMADLEGRARAREALDAYYGTDEDLRFDPVAADLEARQANAAAEALMTPQRDLYGGPEAAFTTTPEGAFTYNQPPPSLNRAQAAQAEQKRRELEAQYGIKARADRKGAENQAEAGRALQQVERDYRRVRTQLEALPDSPQKQQAMDELELRYRVSRAPYMQTLGLKGDDLAY